MCGIFGFEGFEEPGLLRRMAEALRHRGPDAEGFFSDGEGRLSMGTRRLSIIDLSTGDQPIYNEDRSLVVCFNGEIYNYVELRRELAAKGHAFATDGDTEVIVHGYEEWGPDVLRRLNGMFAFALYDVRRGELIIGRDRAGQKPLYYYHENGRFIFASEVKAILESSHVERRCNPRAIDGYLALRYVPQPETLFEGIRVLPAGHCLRLKDGEAVVERYWEVALRDGPYRSDAEYLEAFEATFFGAVERTLRSDVPVGAYLSGGIDSALVVAAMCRFKDRVSTYSIGFDSPVDELGEARTLAIHFGTDHHEIRFGAKDFAELPRVIWHMDRPMGDPLVLAYYKLAEGAGRDLKVVLSGEGADELFAGYSFHKVLLWTEFLTKVVPVVIMKRVGAPAVAAAPVQLLDRFFVYPAYLGQKGRMRLADYLRHYGDRTLGENYAVLRSLWDRDDRAALYADGFREMALAEGWRPRPEDRSGPFLDRLLKLQFDDWLQDNLLMRQDKNTMAHSLEMRAPFLDNELIDLAFTMPPHLKVNGLRDKFIERQLARRILPQDYIRRKKNPFYFPIERMFGSKEVQDLVGLTLNREQVERRGYFRYDYVKWLLERCEANEFLYVKQAFALVILELWHMIFIDRQRLW